MTDAWEDWFQKDERLLWQGAPVPGQWHWGRNIFFTAFGLPFLGAGLFVSGMGLGYIFSPDDIWQIALGIFLTAFGIPFMVAGAAMVFGTWITDYIAPTHTRYALTDRAGYIATRLWKRNMEVLPIHPDSKIEYEELGKDIATIYFDFEHDTDSDGDPKVTKKGFEGISNGRAIYQMIRAIKAGEDVSPL